MKCLFSHSLIYNKNHKNKLAVAVYANKQIKIKIKLLLFHFFILEINESNTYVTVSFYLFAVIL